MPLSLADLILLETATEFAQNSGHYRPILPLAAVRSPPLVGIYGLLGGG